MTEHLDRLRAWAPTRQLVVQHSNATQYDPEFIVALVAGGSRTAPQLMSARSTDSVDTAALYLINKLHWLGIDV